MINVSIDILRDGGLNQGFHQSCAGPGRVTNLTSLEDALHPLNMTIRLCSAVLGTVLLVWSFTSEGLPADTDAAKGVAQNRDGGTWPGAAVVRFPP